jgi:hypothetical protein
MSVLMTETIGNDTLSDGMACAAGTYSVINDSSSNTSCLECLPYTYLETMGNDTLSDSAGDAGKNSVINDSSSNTKYLDCPPGTYLEAMDNDAESDCTECDAGKYSVINGASSDTKYLDCPPGTYLDTIGNDALFDCMACDSGKYSVIYCSSSNTTCLNCAAGKYSVMNGSSSVTTCLNCPPGTAETESNDALSDCMACAAGKYSFINGSSSNTTCLDCPPGTYLDTIGHDALSDCMACAEDKYSVEDGSSTCTACTPNSNSPPQSTDQASCVCNSGYGVDAGGGHCTALPVILFESDRTGKRVGGNVVRVTIENFLFNAVSVLLEVGGNFSNIFSFNIFSKGGNARGLVLITPKFVGVLGDISIKIQPEIDPLKMVYFVYTVEDVQYPTAEAPCMFAVRVSKILKATHVFRMPVTLTAQFIPYVSALEAVSGEIQPTRVARINPDEQFVVHGRCQRSEPEQIVWKFTPPIPLEFYETLADNVSGSVACTAILFGAAVYLTKMNYKTSSEYLAAEAKVMDGAQKKSEEREDAVGEVGRKSNDKNHSGRVSEEGAGVQGVDTDTPAKTGMIEHLISVLSQNMIFDIQFLIPCTTHGKMSSNLESEFSCSSILIIRRQERRK